MENNIEFPVLETANFFWHGTMSLYEYVCIASFVKNGFNVNVYSYHELQLPIGAHLKNAAEILPESDLLKYTQDGKIGNLAAFSDAFRINLQKNHLGWWFDTDMVCLKSSKDFTQLAEKDNRIIVGFQDDHVINGAVLKISDKQLAGKIFTELEQSGTSFEWGYIGPALITRVLKREGLGKYPFKSSVFYPVHFANADFAFRPDKIKEVATSCSDSFTYHLWNEIIYQWKVPKNILPPAGSFLHKLFVDICPEMKAYPTLPIETFERLASPVILKEQINNIMKLNDELIKRNDFIFSGNAPLSRYLKLLAKKILFWFR